MAAWLEKWQASQPKLCDWVEETIEETFAFLRLPRQHHIRMRSTNMLERLNEEIKRRTKVVRIFPDARSCLRLVRALVRRDARELDGGRRPLPEHGSSSRAASGRSAQAGGMSGAPFRLRTLRALWLVQGAAGMESLWTIPSRRCRRASCSGPGLTTSFPHFPRRADRPICRPAAAPLNGVSAAAGRRGLGAGPRPALRGRIRNAENRIHASGFARGASNPKPSLDIPDRNCRTNGTLLAAPENLAAVRRLVVSIVHQMDDKLSIRRRLLRAAQVPIVASSSSPTPRSSPRAASWCAGSQGPQHADDKQ